MYSSIGSIKLRHEGNWFNPALLKGIESEHPAKPCYPVHDGAFFISKERLKGRRTSMGWIPPGPWRFSVRWVDAVGRISTVGKFQGHETLREARKAAKLLQQDHCKRFSLSKGKNP